tara:strand:- start:354 stop:455 length:102 start_codon:yes stop_codon:yes gene_type:complete
MFDEGLGSAFGDNSEKWQRYAMNSIMEENYAEH